jgi:F0F1-type ATP synthase assembly protein I
MSDDNKNDKPDLGLPELPEEWKDLPEFQDLQARGKQPDPPQKPDPEEERKNRMNMWAASQFAYTLVTASVVFGFIGHWLGTLLGGGLWSIFLMLILGGLGFGLETWRMIRTFNNSGKKPQSKDDGNKPKDDDKTSRP